MQSSQQASWMFQYFIASAVSAVISPPDIEAWGFGATPRVKLWFDSLLHAHCQTPQHAPHLGIHEILTRTAVMEEAGRWWKRQRSFENWIRRMGFGWRLQLKRIFNQLVETTEHDICISEFSSALFLVFLDAEILDYFIWIRDFEHALQSNTFFLSFLNFMV